jgi:hypothetical protein
MKHRLTLALAVLAGPAWADDCTAFWDALTQAGGTTSVVSGQVMALDGDWCVFEDVVLDLPGQYVPDWHAERLRLKGGFLPWLTGLLVSGSTGGILPDRLEVEVEDLRLVVQIDDAQMNWLFAAQARSNTIDGEIALAWDAQGRALSIETLRLDFPGDNQVVLSARASGVDLSSTGAIQMSATSFAVTEADVMVQTHGLFEWYALMPLGPIVLPREGNMEAAAAGIRASLTGGVAELPESTFSAKTKANLTALIAELPNPAGTLTWSLRSETGFGPTRVMGFAMTGVPMTIAGLAPLFEGVTIDIGWTHEDMP